MNLTVKQFVNNIFDLDTERSAWMDLNTSGGLADSVATKLQFTNSHYLPELRENRTLLAFMNGIYVVKNDEFVTWDNVPKNSHRILRDINNMEQERVGFETKAVCFTELV